MVSIHTQIAAATTVRDRIVVAVFERHPEIAELIGPDDPSLSHFMTREEWPRWAAIRIVIAEMQKYL
jgi:hypothetical protein